MLKTENGSSDNLRRGSAGKLLITGVAAGILVSIIAVLAYHQSGDARFCSSCHSMKPVHMEWQSSNHRQFTCTECHLPDTHITGKLAYKTSAGLNDLIHETSRDYQVKIGLSEKARHIVTGNCTRCHASTIIDTPMAAGEADCLKCHRYLVHGRGAAKGGVQIE